MANLISGHVLPWKRFWIPWDESMYCGMDGRGFLEDPESRFGRPWNPQVRPIEDLLGFRCLILSGQPGIGKTIEFEKLEEGLRSSGTEIFSFHCRSIGSDTALREATVGHSRWSEARQGEGEIALLIDGVDEGLRKVTDFVFSLTRWLRDEPVARIRVILVCRTAEWDVAAGDELMCLWPKAERGNLHELCPLRRCDAETAAQAMGVNPDRFLAAVHRRRLHGLAARPLTLRMLLEEFRSKEQFSGSHRLLYSNAVRRMCREIDEDRASRLRRTAKHPVTFPEDHLFRVAARIAALLMLAGKSAVFTGSREDAAPTDLLLSEVRFGTEAINDTKFQITEALVDAVLETPLFSSRGVRRYGFDHQAFAECLAAEYLRELSLVQIRQLLCVRLDGRDHVVPMLGEVAAWLAGIHPAWCEFLIQSEPEVLLRSDIGQLSDERKSAVVASLLDRVDREEAFDEHGMSWFYHTLTHPDLAGQLRRYIFDPTKNVVVRRMAIEIAGDAGVAELEGELWNLQLQEGSDGVRHAIAHALDDLAGPHSKRWLLRALDRKCGPDANDDLKGVALRKLVPEVMPLRKVLPYLRIARCTNYYGTYDAVLASYLPEHITRADLPALLRAMTKWQGCFDSIAPGRDLAEHAFSMAISYLDDPLIGQLTARLWLEKCQNYHPLPNTQRAFTDSAGYSIIVKRRFLEILLNDRRLKAEEVYHLREGALLEDSDMRWILEMLLEVSKTRRSVWAATAALLCWRDERTKHRDLLLKAYGAVEELRTALPTPRKGDINVTLDRAIRAGELRWERRRRRNQRDWPPRRELLNNALNVIRSGDPTGWVGLASYVYIDEKDDPKKGEGGRRSDCDVTASVGWLTLSDEEKNQAKRGARDFLLKCKDGRRTPTTFTNFTESGCRAVRLLRNTLRTDAELRRAVKKKWLDGIVDFFDEEQADMIEFAYRLEPGAVIRRLLVQMRAHDRKFAYLLCLRAFEACWDKRLTKAVSSALLQQRWRPGSLKHAIAFLAQRDRTAAVNLVRRLLGNIDAMKLDKRGRALLALAIFDFPQEFWERAFSRLSRSSAQIAQRFFLESVSSIPDRRASFVTAHSDRQIADLYIMLVRLFPPEVYSERHGPNGTVSPKHQIPDLRDACIGALVSQGTESSCNEFQRIISASQANRRIWLRWRYKEALRNRLRKLWAVNVTPPETILRLARSRDATFVRDEEDFVEAIIASLQRLQESMNHGECPPVRVLWNEPPSRLLPKVETTLSDFLRDWFTRDLGPQSNVIVNREAQVARLGKLDLKLEALAGDGFDRRHLVVVIEVKRCIHRQLADLCRTQLVDKYLRPEGWRHGIYLIGWYGTKTAQKWATRDDVTTSVEKWAAAASSNDFTVHGHALDCRFFG